MGIEHVEGVPLVLHAEIEQARILFPHHPLVEPQRPHAVLGLEAQRLLEEREVVQIAGAQDDGIDALVAAVTEIGGIAIDLHQQWLLFPVVRPLEAHRGGAIAGGDAARTILVALRADVLGGIAAAEQQQVLALEFQCITEIMGMQNAAIEAREAGEFRHIGCREMPGGHDDVIESFAGHQIERLVMHADRELLAGIIEGDLAHRAAEANVLAYAGLLDAPRDVVEQHRTRRIGGDRAPEMFFKGVVGELETLLGAIRPQVAIHAAVDRLAVGIQSGTPAVIPQTAPVILLFVTDNLGNLDALVGGGLKGTQLSQATGSCTDDRDTLGHGYLPVLIVSSCVIRGFRTW